MPTPALAPLLLSLLAAAPTVVAAQPPLEVMLRDGTGPTAPSPTLTALRDAVAVAAAAHPPVLAPNAAPRVIYLDDARRWYGRGWFRYTAILTDRGFRQSVTIHATCTVRALPDCAARLLHRARLDRAPRPSRRA